MRLGRAVEGGTRQLDPESLGGHVARLYRAAYGLTGSRQEAEDLVQDTFERVLRRPRFLRRDADLGYLLRVLRNTWIDRYQQQSRRPKTVDLNASVEFVVDAGADPAVSIPELKSVYDAIGVLPVELRETIVAVDIVGLSYRQASAALNVKAGTIMSRLYRARNEVAQRLESVGGADRRGERTA